MNNLILIKKKIQRAERLHRAQLLATRKGEILKYNPSTFEERQKNARKDLENQIIN